MSGNYILLLEDDEDVAELLVLVLRAAGYMSILPSPWLKPSAGLLSEDMGLLSPIGGSPMAMAPSSPIEPPI